MNGFKTYLGAIVRGIAGATGTVLISSLPTLPVDPATAKGVAVAGVLYFLGTALKEVGERHATEKQTDAIKNQTDMIIETAPVKLQDPAAPVPLVAGGGPSAPRKRTGPDSY